MVSAPKKFRSGFSSNRQPEPDCITGFVYELKSHGRGDGRRKGTYVIRREMRPEMFSGDEGGIASRRQSSFRAAILVVLLHQIGMLDLSRLWLLGDWATPRFCGGTFSFRQWRTAVTDSLHDPDENIGRVLAYHGLSKHHLHRYALSPSQLDWANQPDPFRTFANAPPVELPLLADALQTSYADLYTLGAAAPRRSDINTIAVLFELSLGLSAWKEYGGSRWALRCNPSSGNLHPTEGYAVLPALPGIESGVFHYVSRDHTLEQRHAFSGDETARLAAVLPPQSFLIGLSSVHSREAWKYGVRAFRYCQHDVGHTLAAVRYAAAALGWSARLLDHLGDDAVSAWLGLGRGGFAGIDPLDREHPDALVLVGPPVLPVALPGLVAPGGGVWLGSANQLSADHVRWEAIDEAAAATWQPATGRELLPTPRPLPPLPPAPAVPAAALIRQRRSCLGLDGRTSLDATAFYRMLDCLLPRPEVAPWDLLPWQPLVHAAVFVHRVRGLEPGLYIFERLHSGPRRSQGCLSVHVPVAATR